MKFVVLICSLVLASVAAQAIPLVITPLGSEASSIEVDVNFDGSTRRFQFDTGANKTVVSLDDKTKEYEKLGNSESKGAAGVAQKCERIAPEKIMIGRLTLTKAEISRCDFGGRNFNNFGIGLLQGKVLEFDFKTNQVFISENAKLSWIPKNLLRLEKGHLKMPMELAGAKMFGLFDTGAQITAVDAKFVLANPKLFKFQNEVTGGDVTGNPVAFKFYQVDNLRIGSLNTGPILVAAYDFTEETRKYFGTNMPFILGTNVIMKANWMIDLKKNQWDATPL